MLRAQRLWLIALLTGSTVAGAQAVTVGASVRLDGMQVGTFQANGPETGWGETFRAPDATDTYLSSWSFWMIPGFDPNLFSFALQIAEWDGGVMGPPIFSTTAVTTTGTQQTFDVGLALDPTKTYIAYINPDVPAADPSRGVFFYSCTECTFGYINPVDAYTDGALVSLQSSLAPDNTYRDISDHPITTVYDNVEWNGPEGVLKHLDAQFEATFTPAIVATPEPGTFVLLGTGLAVLGFIGLRRKRAQ